MGHLIQDIRYGLRSFVRQPAFALTAVLALGLGIGANTAVFSAVYGVLVRPLPFPQPEGLVWIEDTYPQVPNAAVSARKLQALRQGNRTLSALGGYTPATVTLTGGGEPEQVQAVGITADVFRAMAVEPVVGRWFTAEEDAPNGPPAIVLNELLWRRRFGADPSIVGKQIQVNGAARTVVGVMPELAFPAALAWVPLGLPPSPEGGSNFMRLVGRMKPGVTFEQARADLKAVTAAFNQANGTARDVTVVALHDFFAGSNRVLLLILQGAVAFVLLVACANVANLLLARGVARQRELAVRAAIGAGRSRLVRQMLTESLMLSIAGGVAGVLLGSWMLRLFLSIAPANFPRRDAMALDSGVLLFTVAVAMLTGLLFGLAPARLGFRTNPNDSLREGGARGGTSGGSRGASRTLVVAEIALALVLVVGAGLMVRSLWRLQGQSTGFSAAEVFTFNLSLPASKYADAAPARFYQALVDEVRALPGVEAAAAINFAPMINYGFNGPFTVQGQPAADPNRRPISEFRYVTPGYFDTMQIPIVRGQDFARGHDQAAPPVAIINQAMAERHFGGQDPVGARIWVSADPPDVIREVIGVVGDVRDGRLDLPPVPETFLPHAQTPRTSMAIMVRTAGAVGLDGVLPAIRRRLAVMDPDLPIVRPQALQAAVEATAGTTRMTSVLIGVFALVGAVLAALGVYSLIAYSVAQRTREIGIRVALGASRGAVLQLVAGEGLVLGLLGLALGIPGALLLTGVLRSLLYEVSASDPVVLTATSAGVLVVAVVASIVPALRAVRIDPMTALRAE